MREKRVVRIVPNIYYTADPPKDSGTFCIEEHWQGGAVRSPFSSREEAKQRAREIAEYQGYDLILEHVFSPLFPDYGWLKLALQREPLDSKLIRILNDRGWYKAVPFERGPLRADADAERAARAREIEGK